MNENDVAVEPTDFWYIDSKYHIHCEEYIEYHKDAMDWDLVSQYQTLSEPFIVDRDNGDISVDDVAVMAPYGVNKLDESFTVEHLSGSKMVLKSERLRLSFRKY